MHTHTHRYDAVLVQSGFEIASGEEFASRVFQSIHTAMDVDQDAAPIEVSACTRVKKRRVCVCVNVLLIVRVCKFVLTWTKTLRRSR
jgi:hypothetical protein